MKEKHVILTLDAGGTNLVFSAYKNAVEITAPVTIASNPENKDALIQSISNGFKRIIGLCKEPVAAISIAFPGPCDYENGLVGNLPNFPAFKNHFPLGPYLEDEFNIPIFITNDGNLFAYGEWAYGFRPFVNSILHENNCKKFFNNLFGITIGTGFGGGLIINGNLVEGDNSSSGEIWCTSNSIFPNYCSEAFVGKNSILSLYENLKDKSNSAVHDPKIVFDIAEGKKVGDTDAAKEAFNIMGRVAGDAVANCLSIIDGLVVIGGGLSGAYPLFIKAFMKQLNGKLLHQSGSYVQRLELEAFDIEDEKQKSKFVKGKTKEIFLPGKKQKIIYDCMPRTAVGLSNLGTNKAVALGAYMRAVNELSKQ